MTDLGITTASVDVTRHSSYASRPIVPRQPLQRAAICRFS